MLLCLWPRRVRCDPNNRVHDNMRVVYCAYGGTRHMAEMQRSARSLLTWHPDAEVQCYTTVDDAVHVCDRRISVSIMAGVSPAPGSWHDHRLKVRAIQEAWRNSAPLLYLDNDTYVLGPLHEPWVLLDSFDLLACAAPITDQRVAKKMRPLPGEFRVPAAFGEVNCGVLFIASTAAAGRLLDRWSELLELNPEEPGDQWRLRIALWELRPRVHVLSNNFNYRLPMRQSVFGPILLLHGRANDLGAVGDALNSDTECRFVERTPDGYKTRR